MFAQMRFGAGLNSGFNRIGLYFDAGADVAFKAHEIHLGARYYGPDYVFETNVIGPSVAYQYRFSQGGWFFAPGMSAAFFHENKSAVELSLFDLSARYTFGYDFGYRFAIYSSLGLGSVINRYTAGNEITSTLSYINYEFSVGIKYYWHSSADN